MPSASQQLVAISDNVGKGMDSKEMVCMRSQHALNLITLPVFLLAPLLLPPQLLLPPLMPLLPPLLLLAAQMANSGPMGLHAHITSPLIPLPGGCEASCDPN